MVSADHVNEKTVAKAKMVESLREFEGLKISLPLGNPNLKLVHTNQFLFTNLPTDVFELANFGLISKKLLSNETRYTQYQQNKWYIEELTITNEGGSGKMELTLNPFASSLTKYKDEAKNFTEAYKEAFESNNNSESKTKKVASVNSGKNSTLRGGEGKTIDNAVAKIVGKTTDELKKAKLIHNWLLKHCPYDYYYNSKYSSATTVYKKVTNGVKVNCADTSRLTRAMMYSAGLKANVRHIDGHYFTEMKCNGKWYCSDATSRQRKFNYYYVCRGCANRKYTYRPGKNNGKNPES